jgi:hypothetical protein
MNITLNTRGDTRSFRATMRVRRDHFIWFSITAPLGIEIGRVLLTPDSVKFINSHDKTYFINDYSYFHDRYGINLTFDCIQRILSNHFFDFNFCSLREKPVKKYKLDRRDGHYLLSTFGESSINRRLKKLYKKKLKDKEYSLILQKIEIDPSFFRPSSVSVEELDEKTGFGVSYRDFRPFGDHFIFPTKIDFHFFSGEDKSFLKIEIDRLEFNIPVEPNFKIPAKYKKIK